MLIGGSVLIVFGVGIFLLRLHASPTRRRGAAIRGLLYVELGLALVVGHYSPAVGGSLLILSFLTAVVVFYGFLHQRSQDRDVS